MIHLSESAPTAAALLPCRRAHFDEGPLTAVFRSDRLLTVGIAAPLKRLARGQSFGIPVLMYHSISPLASAAGHPYFETRTAPDRFRMHMELLRARGYAAITLAEQQRLFKAPGGTESPKPVVITFDDGYEDFFHSAFPVLHELGLTATVFLPTGRVGGTDSSGFRYLSWTQVRELRKCGVLFGSHTVSHSELRFLDSRQVQLELTQSRTRIEDELGESIDSFSHPYAFPDDDADYVSRFRAALGQAGYRYAVTTTVGVACPEDDVFCLPRLPVNSHDDSVFFRAKLHGAYDWLKVPQRLYKLVRHRTDRRRTRAEALKG